jgi:carbonic anhydrase
MRIFGAFIVIAAIGFNVVMGVLTGVLIGAWTNGDAIAQPIPPAIAQLETPWSYQAATGPDHWAELDPAFATCQSGQAQSPINLTATDTVPEIADVTNLDFHYESVPLNLLNNGHTIQVPYAPGSYVMIEGDRYNLLQFHFHSPSEHAIDNQLWDAELHLVHQNDQGKLAVVAVLLQAKDAASSAEDFDQLSKNLPAHAGDKIRTDTTINAQNLLPSQTTTYRYTGSLTTPPCSESVSWLIMSEPVSLSTKQINQYKKLLNHNNRPLQLRQSSAVVQIDTSPN